MQYQPKKLLTYDNTQKLLINVIILYYSFVPKSNNLCKLNEAPKVYLLIAKHRT
jgi:hypothetical protein